MQRDIRFDGMFGIERETLRVTKDGRLAQTVHPFENKYLSRDFCENQLEIITPACTSIPEAVKALKKLSDEAIEVLKPMGEGLWFSSNPPYFESDNEIPIANYVGKQVEKHHYRVNLERRYGKRLMLYSGIHFNLSFSEEYIQKKGEGKNAFYMKLLKYSMKYSWLLTLLTAASPVYDASLEMEGKKGTTFSGYASMRNGEHGYWNQFDPVLDYSDLESYCVSVKNLIAKGALFSAGELYLPVRVKAPGENSIERLQNLGIDHLELRMFDLNPLYPLGVNPEDLVFAHALMVYFAEMDDVSFTKEEQLMALKNHKNAAKYHLDHVQIENENIVKKALEILEDMKQYFSEDSELVKVISFQMEKLEKKQRYADILEKTQGKDFQKSILKLV